MVRYQRTDSSNEGIFAFSSQYLPLYDIVQYTIKISPVLMHAQTIRQIAFTVLNVLAYASSKIIEMIQNVCAIVISTLNLVTITNTLRLIMPFVSYFRVILKYYKSEIHYPRKKVFFSQVVCKCCSIIL